MLDLRQAAGPASPLPIDLRIAESLRELSRAFGHFPNAGRLETLAQGVEAGSALHPSAYGTYFQVIGAVQASDDAALPALIAELAKAPLSDGIQIRMLSIEEFGRKGVKTARDDFASDSLLHTQIGLVPAGAAARMRRALTSALAFIQEMSPEAWQDITNVTTEIVAAFGRPRGMMTFDGSSSLERYGSVLINMKRDRSLLGLAETLVHESAHGLLFGLSCNDRLVLNPASERYASPLRIDPRPLEGIYHAVFVLARMFAFVQDVAGNPKATDAMRAGAEKRMEVRRKNFLDGYAVLQEHAKLTDTGRSLLDDAYARVMTAR